MLATREKGGIYDAVPWRERGIYGAAPGLEFAFAPPISVRPWESE
jgi:hypothetical protein